MKNITIFGLWILTVVIGSVFLALFTAMLDGGGFGDFFGIIVLSAMLSFLFSIPAVITFLIANSKFLVKYQNTSLYRTKMYVTQVITGGVYLIVSAATILMNGADSSSALILLGLLACYLPVGLICWYFGFKRENVKPITGDNILDN